MATLAEQLAQAKTEDAKADKLNDMIKDIAIIVVNDTPEKIAEAYVEVGHFCRPQKWMYDAISMRIMTEAILMSSAAHTQEKLKLASMWTKKAIIV